MTSSLAVEKVAVVALIALTVFVGSVRPLAHPESRFFPQFRGLTRMTLLSESPDADSTTLPVPVATDAQLIVPPLLVGLLALVLKARRTELSPVPLRRLKLPARSAGRSPTAH